MPNFKKKISIVVPVYNASNTIERCVQSILSQTYTNIEIILVDDGSKDNSLEICKKLQSRDSRIVVVSGKNAGVSVARNKGIEMANGDYIAFVDSDDYVKPEMYEKLINIAESRKVSLVFCNYEEVTTSGDSRKVNQLSRINEGNNLSENIKVIEYMLQITNASIFGCCWRTLINVNLLTQNSIRFTPGITMAEDLKFILECLGVTSKIGICNEYLYYFVVNEISTTSKYMKKQDQDMYTVNMWIREFIEKFQTSRDLYKNSSICIANTVVINAANVCKKFSPYSLLERVHYIKSKRKQEDYRLALRVAFYNRKFIMKKQWLQMTLIHFNLEVLVILYHSLKYRNFKKYAD